MYIKSSNTSFCTMNCIKTIRDKLGMTQAALAHVLGMTQGNVAFYERGQAVPPPVARRLICYARSQGHALGYEDVYGPVDSDQIQPVAPANQAQAAINTEAQQSAKGVA